MHQQAKNNGVADRWSVARLALAVFILAALVRFWFVFIEHEPWKYVAADIAEYVSRAERLKAGVYGPQDAFIPVGYPAFIAGIIALGVGLKTVAFVQILAGALGAAACVAIVARMTGSRAAAGVGGFIAALYPPSVFFTGFFLTETITCALITVAIACLTVPRGTGRVWGIVTGGILLGAAASVRPNIAIFLPILLALAVVLVRSGRRSRVSGMVATVAVAVACLAPASAFTSHITGRLSGPGTNGGVNFFLAMTEYQVVREGTPIGFGVLQIVPSNERSMYLSPRSLTDERFFYRETIRRVVERPALLLAIPDRIRRGIGLGQEPLWPGMPGYDRLLAFSVTILTLLALLPAILRVPVDLLMRRATPWTRAVCWGATLSLVLTLAFFLAEPRMTVPFAPILIALGCDAWAWAIELVKTRAHLPTNQDMRVLST